MDDDFTAAAEARELPGPFGKFTEVAKTHLDEHTNNLMLRTAAQAGKLPGVWMRDVLYLVLHGETPAELVAKWDKDMKAQLRGEGPDEVRRRAGELR